MNSTLAILKNYWIEGLIFIFFAILYLWVSLSKPIVELEDSFSFFTRARNLVAESDSKNWVDGFYPLGYPLLLNLFFYFLKDYLFAAKALSIISGLIIIIYFYRINKLFYKDSIAIFPTLFLGLNGSFLKYATSDNTDIVCLSFLVIALYHLLKAVNGSKYFIITAGAVLGLAYLIRYTTLLFVFPAIVWIILFVDIPFIQRLQRVLLFGAAFLLFACPQLIVSYKVTENAFYNQQASNVWFGMYGEGNYSHNWFEALKHTNLFEIITADPERFLNNFYINIKKAFLMTIFRFPLFICSFFGFIIFAFFTPKNRKQGILIILTGLVYGLGICIAFISTSRLILFVLVGQVFLGSYAIVFLLTSKSKLINKIPEGIKNIMLYACFTSVTILTFVQQIVPVIKQPVSEEGKEIITVNKILQANNSYKPEQVFSLSLRVYNISSPYKSLFPCTWYGSNLSFNSCDDLKKYMQENNFSYIVLDNEACSNIPSFCNLGQPGFSAEFCNYFQSIYKGNTIKAYRLIKI